MAWLKARLPIPLSPERRVRVGEAFEVSETLAAKYRRQGLAVDTAPPADDAAAGEASIDLTTAASVPELVESPAKKARGRTKPAA